MSDNLSAVIQLLGEKNVEKLKEELTQELIENLCDSIHEEWVVLPTEVNEMWSEFLAECFAKVRKKYKTQITEAMCRRMEQIIKELGDTE